jgi:hypothetical protein
MPSKTVESTGSVPLPSAGQEIQEDEGARKGGEPERPKPDPARVRNWSDRSGSFNIEASFIALGDEKVHLHKLNGVKIGVPIIKMSVGDLKYIGKVTGQSLDEWIGRREQNGDQ